MRCPYVVRVKRLAVEPRTSSSQDLGCCSGREQTRAHPKSRLESNLDKTTLWISQPARAYEGPQHDTARRSCPTSCCIPSFAALLSLDIRLQQTPYLSNQSTVLRQTSCKMPASSFAAASSAAFPAENPIAMQQDPPRLGAASGTSASSSRSTLYSSSAGGSYVNNTKHSRHTRSEGGGGGSLSFFSKLIGGVGSSSAHALSSYNISRPIARQDSFEWKCAGEESGDLLYEVDLEQREQPSRLPTVCPASMHAILPKSKLTSPLLRVSCLSSRSSRCAHLHSHIHVPRLPTQRSRQQARCSLSRTSHYQLFHSLQHPKSKHDHLPLMSSSKSMSCPSSACRARTR